MTPSIPPTTPSAVLAAAGSSNPNASSIWAPASPKRIARSGSVPCPISRPSAKMPIRSQTSWTWLSRWLERRIAGPAVVDDAPQELEDLDDAERVDRGRRLVEDQDVGVLHERVGDAEALEHAPRVRVGPVVGAAQAGPTWSRTASIVALASLSGIRLRRAV